MRKIALLSLSGSIRTQGRLADGVLVGVLGVEVLDGRLDSILSQHGAVHLHGGQRELLSNSGVLDLSGFIKAHTLNKSSHIGGGGNSAATAEGLELNVLDLSVVVDLDLELHDITASRGTDETSTNVLQLLVHGTDISGVVIVVNNLGVVESRLGERREGRSRSAGSRLSDELQHCLLTITVRMFGNAKKFDVRILSLQITTYGLGENVYIYALYGIEPWL